MYGLPAPRHQRGDKSVAAAGGKSGEDGTEEARRGGKTEGRGKIERDVGKRVSKWGLCY